MSANKESVLSIRPMYLRKPGAAAFLAISESTFDVLVARGSISKPRKLSPGSSGWLVEELEAYGRDLPISDLLPPKNSGHGRAGKPA